MTDTVPSQTPALTLDLNRISQNYARLVNAFHGSAQICYAMKANNHPAVLRHLRGLGSGFDVASGGEIDTLRQLGVPGHLIYFSNPIKTVEGLQKAKKAGVTRFAIDCRDEIEKIAAHVPGAKVYVRLVVPNVGSGWPLTRQFGATPDEAVELLVEAAEAGLVPIGVTFHVGSQCTNLQNWREALNVCDQVWTQAMARGINTLCLLDMGGGFPVPYNEQERGPDPQDVATVVAEGLEGRFPGLISIVLEPGRYMVAEAGVLYAKVTAVAERGSETIAYLECGIFNGFMESQGWNLKKPGEFWFPIDLMVDENEWRPAKTVTLMGPSCDSVDVVVSGLPFVELRKGDVLRFRMAGAYTNSYQDYNGLKYPVVMDLRIAEGNLRLLKNG